MEPGEFEKSVKRLPAGVQDFQQMIQDGCCYAEKTRFIQSVMTGTPKVLLMTRPPRFGKTLFMDTLARFLRHEEGRGAQAEAPEALFAGLEVSKDRDFCEAFMGRFPVVFLSLKRLYGDDFHEVYCKFTSLMAEVCAPFAYLQESPKLLSQDKMRLRQCLDPDYLADPAHRTTATQCLQVLVKGLWQHHGKPVVLLVDDCDVPLVKAEASGFLDEVIGLIQPLLVNVLKLDSAAGATPLQKVVMMGVLPVVASLLVDDCALGMNTVCSDEASLGAAMGFTREETKSLLSDCGLSARVNDVLSWYDGYRFAGIDVLCPTDVVNFCRWRIGCPDSLARRPENGWDGAGRRTICELLNGIMREDADRLQTLLDGGVAEVTVQEPLDVRGRDFHRSTGLWMRLLFTGYLTAVERRTEDGACKVRIPNEEIRAVFVQQVKERFSVANEGFALQGTQFVEAALAGEADRLTAVLAQVLKTGVSVAKAGSEARDWLAALLACSEISTAQLAPQDESWGGWADVVFMAGVGARRIGVAFALKRVVRPEELREAAEFALKELQSSPGAAVFDKFRCGRKCFYGVAFCRRECAVVGGA